MAGFYQKYIIPHMIRLGCGCQTVGELRKPIVSQAKGRVLELGIGAGANLTYYDRSQITEVVGVDPSKELCDMVLATPEAKNFPLKVIPVGAEDLPFDVASFDTVTCTFTLCSVDDPIQALNEVKRVLKPGGTFLFCEHGRAPDVDVAKFQDRIDPLWSILAGGCHVCRPVRGSIETQFSISQWDGSYKTKYSRFVSWMECGVAHNTLT